jgi:multidrug efflux pump subunit AcrA (membrane-fusion protein)
MKIRLAAIALILVGVGAVALVMVGPTFGASAGTKYTTATVTTGAVSATSVATGTVAASTVYGLKFGTTPDIVSTTATTSGAGGSTSNSNTGSTTTLTWPVQTVSVTVGQKVTKGTVLAAADSTAAQLALASAQATLASAQSKLATDKGGPDSLTKAQAKNQLSQASNSYKQAKASKANTNAQNALKLSQAKAAVTAAQNAYNGDPSPSNQTALANAQANLQSTQLSVNQSNQQASQQVTSASLSYQAAKLAYEGKVAPASTATVQADQATVASAQATVNADQAAVTAATLTAPADGLIIAVNLLPGVNAPTGYAIEESVGPMVANCSFAESDIAKLKIGQTASVTISGGSTSAVAGTLTQIVPVASSSSGGSSSVATYAVTVTLTSPPDTVLAGMSATVTVTTASVDNVLRVPATALEGSATSGYAVLVMNGSSTTTTPVTVGLVTTSYAEIKSGLAAGQTVVTGTITARTGTTTTGGGVNVNSLTGGGGFQGGFGR